jgi:PPOX class probable F420-dependent enzyme
MTEFLSRFGEATFVSLETYRRHGQPITTPLWCGVEDGRLLVWTPRDSMKVRRARRNPAGRLARCSATGRKILGEWCDVTISILKDPTNISAAHRAIHRKYGWQLTLMEKTLWMRGLNARGFIALELRSESRATRRV